MAFDDVRNISYKALIEHTQKVKPYRDSDGAYNLGARRYSDRHYRVRDDGVIDVFFAHMGWEKSKINNGENLQANGGRRLASIHPDNSIEIHNYNGVGDIQFLCALVRYVTHSKAHHGLMIRGFNRWKSDGTTQSHPVFKGGRFHLESLETLTPYILQPKMVNRKMRSEVIARFDLHKKVALTMFNVMSPSGIFEIYRELWNEYGDDYMHHVNGEVVVKLVHEGKHLDALLMSVLSKSDVGWWGMWRIRQLLAEEKQGNASDHRMRGFLGENFSREVNELYLSTGESKGKLDDLLIKGSPDAFTYKDPIPNGQAIPSSKWGYKLTDLEGNNLFRVI